MGYMAYMWRGSEPLTAFFQSSWTLKLVQMLFLGPSGNRRYPGDWWRTDETRLLVAWCRILTQTCDARMHLTQRLPQSCHRLLQLANNNVPCSTHKVVSEASDSNLFAHHLHPYSLPHSKTLFSIFSSVQLTNHRPQSSSTTLPPAPVVSLPG